MARRSTCSAIGASLDWRLRASKPSFRPLLLGLERQTHWPALHGVAGPDQFSSQAGVTVVAEPVDTRPLAGSGAPRPEPLFSGTLTKLKLTLVLGSTSP